MERGGKKDATKDLANFAGEVCDQKDKMGWSGVERCLVGVR